MKSNYLYLVKAALSLNRHLPYGILLYRIYSTGGENVTLSVRDLGEHCTEYVNVSNFILQFNNTKHLSTD